MRKEDYFTLIEKNEFDKLKELISMNKNLLNEHTISGYSGLHVAVSNISIESAKILIQMGTNVNSQDEDGQTALHYCAEYYQYEIAKSILEHGGDLSISDKYGNQALWTCTFNVQNDLTGLDILELFLLNGADINHKNKVGKTPWDIAHDPYFAPIVKMMEKYGDKNWRY
ncbi:MAG: ankyrin repeat domain-containing protein [Chitinophagaceae bacterium]|nr:ankyrin repeat domain-containing protein [Chitinophagaceae bacterium]